MDMVKRLRGSFQAWRQRNKRLFLLIVVSFVLVIVGQFVYPEDRSLPFTKLDGMRVGSMTETDITQLLIDKYSNVSVKTEFAGPVKKSSHTAKTTAIGLSPDADKVFSGLESYRWWQRLIPFSLVFAGMFNNQAVTPEIDDAKFSEYAKARLKECAVAPVNAGVKIDQEKVELSPSKDGQKCNEQGFRRALLSAPIKQSGMVAEIPVETIKPDRTDKDVEGKLEEAKKIVNRSIKLELIDEEVAVPRSTIASWLVFKEDPKDKKKLIVDVDTKVVREYVAEMQKKIYIAPSPTVIKTVDGVEVSRSGGGPGRGLNHTDTADALKKQVLDGDGTAKATVVAIQPPATYERSYSATKNGLQAMLNDIVMDKGDYAISVRFLDGSVVSARGGVAYHPASTYKLSVAYSLLLRIARDEIKWTDAATGGKNVSQCFDVMIVNSDNPCSEWFGSKIGWNTITSESRAIGMSSTNMGFGTKSSTVNDQTLFLMKLQNGSLLEPAERDRLLSVMKRQVYRSGIPAGTRVSVADKVGFLDGMLHDSAIVYAPGGTYTMSIYTKGSTWGAMADAARQINTQINRL